MTPAEKASARERGDGGQCVDCGREMTEYEYKRCDWAAEGVQYNCKSSHKEAIQRSRAAV